MSGDPTPAQPAEPGNLFGHPAGLYTLFFAELWERFSFYGMRALLFLYMTKRAWGQYSDPDATAIYGAYLALVYMTPFFGGYLADRLLGARRAVVFGGLLMAAGHLLMTQEQHLAFFGALALLICGNGFFKPNISTMVGSLYPPGSRKRDSGFTIFYMGINLGAASASLLCGFVGETIGWHVGFGLATAGMLTGLMVFVAPRWLAQLAILVGVLATAWGLFVFQPNNLYSTAVSTALGVALIAAGAVAVAGLGRGGLPADLGAPPDRQRLTKPVFGVLTAEWSVYLGTIVAVGIFMLLVSGFAPFGGPPRSLLDYLPQETVKQFQEGSSQGMRALGIVLKQIGTPAGLFLSLGVIGALIYLLREASLLEKVPRQRLYAVLILMFFSMQFWAFFEQAGSSLTNFTDRNVDRVFQQQTITAEQVGTTISIQPTQEQLGYSNGDRVFTLQDLNQLRKDHPDDRDFQISWTVASDNVGMGIASRNDEIPASTFQAANPIFILIFGLVFAALWGVLAIYGLEPSTPVKFAGGLLQLGLGFAALWWGAQTADDRGMVWLGWLLIGYLLHTTGELCISPVGLSMITKLTPGQLVSTVMGGWFLATGYAGFVSGIIAQFAAVGETAGADQAGFPVPAETLHIYGDVFANIALCAIISPLILLALSPLLQRWMHSDQLGRDQDWQGPSQAER